MALLKNGSITDFSVKVKNEFASIKPALSNFKRFDEMLEVSRTVEDNSFELIRSQEKRGVSLKTIKLTEGFEGFLSNMLKSSNEIYFIAWVWDLSGRPVFQYPGEGFSSEDVIIKLKAGNLREFIGEGINLFPKDYVTGGISIRLQVWESDQETRNFGKILTETADTIKKSELNNLLSMISLISGVSGATITLIEKAALELAGLIGTILKANSNDYVDLFEGYYAADQNWVTGIEKYNANSCEIELKKY